MIRDGPGGSVPVQVPSGARGHRCSLRERVRAVVRSGEDRDRLASEGYAGAAHQHSAQGHGPAIADSRPSRRSHAERLQLPPGFAIARRLRLVGAAFTARRSERDRPEQDGRRAAGCEDVPRQHRRTRRRPGRMQRSVARNCQNGPSNLLNGAQTLRSASYTRRRRGGLGWRLAAAHCGHRLDADPGDRGCPRWQDLRPGR